ncbi:MAG TPA: alpha/beta hydrolase [Opitutaceae bacterium]|nr:alpha/beta hydrolase [Opitutaceae bacterium]
MKSLAMMMAACVALAAPALAAEKAAEKAPEKTYPVPPPPVVPPAFTLNVWPGLPPGDKPGMPPEEWKYSSNTVTGTVSTPTLAVYRPAKDKDNGAVVLVCPGGGFFQLSMGHEGADVAVWLNSIGITGVVLKYRIPGREGMPRYMPALQDAQRAMSIIRSKAAEWNIDPKRVGVLGFSAGGQVGADLETNFDHRMYEPVDDMDKAPTRPDFAVLIYPGGTIQRGTDVPTVGAEIHITKDTPQTFLSISDDDRNGSENAVYLYLALKKAGVPSELHVYGEGGHGYGIRPGTAPHATWPARVADWMAQRGLLKPATMAAAAK